MKVTCVVSANALNPTPLVLCTALLPGSTHNKSIQEANR